MQDLGPGLNYNKKGLQQLIKRICAGSAGRLVLTNKDRLLRFGWELVFSLCEIFNRPLAKVRIKPEVQSYR